MVIRKNIENSQPYPLKQKAIFAGVFASIASVSAVAGDAMSSSHVYSVPSVYFARADVPCMKNCCKHPSHCLLVPMNSRDFV